MNKSLNKRNDNENDNTEPRNEQDNAQIQNDKRNEQPESTNENQEQKVTEVKQNIVWKNDLKPLIIPKNASNSLDLEIKNPSFLDTGLSALLRSAKYDHDKINIPMVILTTSQLNFYNTIPLLMYGEDGSENFYPLDGSTGIGVDKFMQYATSSFKALSHTRILGIKFNDWEYPFTINPMSHSLISDTNKDFSSTMDMAIKVPGTGDIVEDVTSRDTMVQLLSSIFYIMCGCVYSYGNRYYVSEVSPSNDVYGDPRNQVGIAPIEQILDCAEYKDSETNFFVGRLEQMNRYTPQLANMTGYIPRIDPNYQHNFNLLGITWPNETVRNAINTAFPVARPFGTMSHTAHILEVKKIYEAVIMNSDYVANQLSVNYSIFLERNRLDRGQLSELLNSMVLNRGDFRNDTSTYNFTNFDLIYNDSDRIIPNFGFFPGAREYISGFEIGRRFSGSLANEYAHLTSLMTDHLEPFPFMKLSESLGPLTESTNTVLFTSLSGLVTAMTDRVTECAPYNIAEYAALDMLSPFVRIPVTVTDFSNTPNPIAFAFHLLSLHVEKIMFPNLWLRNRLCWVSKCHDFLIKYFHLEYSRLYSIYGLGTNNNRNGLPVIIFRTEGFTKLEMHNANFTLDRQLRNIGVTDASLFGRVILGLRLDRNNVAEDIVVNSAYRVRPRTVRTPGACYAVTSGDVLLPASIYLRDVLTVAQDYKLGLNEASMQKGLTMAFNHVMRSFPSVCASFGSWFHWVYCVSYRKIAKSPLLTIPDDESIIPYDSIPISYDNIRTLDPTFAYSVPYENGAYIELKGITGQLFANRLTQMSRFLFLCANVPYSLNAGFQTNVRNDLDMSLYAYLYDNVSVPKMLNMYFNELVSRQQAMEVTSIASRLSIGRLIEIQSIVDLLRASSLMQGVTASSFAYIRKALSKRNVDYNGVDGLSYKAANNLYNDPRIYSPAFGHTNSSMTIRQVTLVDGNCIRNEVLENFNLILSRCFSLDEGIKGINLGVTICRAPLINPLVYTRAHTIPKPEIILSESRLTIVDGNLNRRLLWRVTHDDNGRIIHANVSRPIEVLNWLRNEIAIQGPAPYFTIVINRRFISTDVVDFMTKCVNEGLCTIHIKDLPNVPVYVSTNSMRANDDGLLTASSVKELVSHNQLAIESVPVYDTSNEMSSTVLESVIVPVLPQNTHEPKIVYSGLNRPGGVQVRIDEGCCPIVSPVITEVSPQEVRVGQYTVAMDLVAPYSLQTSRLVYYVKPNTSAFFIKRSC